MYSTPCASRPSISSRTTLTRHGADTFAKIVLCAERAMVRAAARRLHFRAGPCGVRFEAVVMMACRWIYASGQRSAGSAPCRWHACPLKPRLAVHQVADRLRLPPGPAKLRQNLFALADHYGLDPELSQGRLGCRRSMRTDRDHCYRRHRAVREQSPGARATREERMRQNR